MTRWLVGLSLLLLMASSASAQVVPETVVSWDVEFWAAGVTPGVGAPIQPATNFARASAVCNLAPVVAPGAVANPTKILVDDPAVAGRDCQLGPTTSAGLLASIPIGAGITATAIARGATLQSARSAASNPFNRAVAPAPPPTPTGLRVLP